ncbi:molybdenum cofactor biosynthesis protein [Bacillus sp. AFS076308]|uniref:MogA/MoaB family molybdenum cofactor biosynthesis protein n=1 Tax=unclassified Bacillus (in: firmicutes) TaxID=185979 RepID=UPI000BF59250|nr:MULTISPECIES: MogA/MoaB family molybdenum cofactor biosynthesis protein [unclassified Bacillus (in: firmicutes)]PFN75237.1 molybdenum cofactor biosynthesis protein [Bacillus sp. AFS076308]PGV45048.1 molybdenum cofactor biosynthesis protein [Bacillus sp. AFS037270]
MSSEEHKKEAPKAVRCKIITVSDTRNQETDKSGKLMMEMLEGAGHKIVDYCIVKDEIAPIQAEILKGCDREDIDVILTNGGTGIAKRDVTIETVEGLLEKEIVGFGELFRMLSYQEDIGSAAILSRAIAGVVKDKAIFSTPGSTGAVKLAMSKLILPEIGHVVRELKKDL